MDIRVKAAGLAGSAVLAEHARRRLQSRLLDRSDRVERVDVRLGDTCSRGGVHDVYCLVQLHLNGAPSAAVVDIGTDMWATIDRTADRVGRLAGEQIARAHAKAQDELATQARR
ncbi:MAG TPA: hypothetical protein VGE16_07050 [Albitalea sp.]